MAMTGLKTLAIDSRDGSGGVLCAECGVWRGRQGPGSLRRGTHGRGCQLMNAITLHQPWASLMAAQLKYIETRGWMPPSRCVFKRMALHAASKRSKHYPHLHMRALERHYGPLWQMPFGAVVATAILMAVCQVVGHSDSGEPLYTLVEGREPPGGIGEDPWGDFSLGRYLWVFGDIRELDTPIPARGRQKVWQWNPADVPAS